MPALGHGCLTPQVSLVSVDEMAAALTPGFPTNFSIQPFPRQGTSPSFALLLSPCQKHLQILSKPHSGPENLSKPTGSPWKHLYFILMWVFSDWREWGHLDLCWFQLIYAGTAWINKPTNTDKFFYLSLAYPVAAFISETLLMKKKKTLGNTFKNLLWDGNSIVSYWVTAAILLQTNKDLAS